MPGSSDSVKVAVRVRPFNQREKNAASGCVISMNGKSTTITNPENGDTKTFAFDHSYWSHDSYREDENGVYIAEPSTNYADQRQVYSDLGQGVLDNAWQGYNAALFAYGQTGSGKSYSMIGYGPNKGIVPITCEELFKAVESNKDENKELQVSFSMLEIYNEQVRDLLMKGKQQGGLRIRQNPKDGFYVEGLKQVPVRDYKEIEKLMEQGTVNRTTASTNMNATSSRSHMVITIRFAQIIKNVAGERNTRSSDINLVDLAGSERADSTGATGDRLKEGSAINQSLSTLGNVISALADLAMGKKKVLVPYRDSVLTKLLQSALGGNSRTIMIAALSPAAINYDETLSTLRYADRAKKIQNKAVVNESPTDRLIRELKEENAKLMEALKKQGGKRGISDNNDLQNLLRENELRLQQINMTWEQRLDQARKEWAKSQDTSQQEEWQSLPYFTNINEDPQLNGIIKHCFHSGKSMFGKGPDVTYSIRGLGIQGNHAAIEYKGSTVTMEPLNSSKIYVNGQKLKGRIHLEHLSRIKFGSNCLFLYVGIPQDRKSNDQMEKYDFDFFMTELAEHRGVAVDIHTSLVNDSTDNLKSTLILQEYINLLPQISEANAISEELKKEVTFEPEVKSESSHDPQGRSVGKEVLIRLTNRKTKKVWVWTKSKFLHRKDLMDEMYVKYMDGENINVPRDKDPFWDPVEDIFLGSCHVMLQSLAYCVDTDEHFTLHNYHGKEEAVIHVKILPTDQKGEFLGEDSIVEPRELLGKRFDFKISLPQCMGIRWIMEDSTRGIYCKMSFNEQEPVRTKTVWGKSYADIHFEKQFTEKKVSQSFINYLQTHSLVLELWGTQDPDEKIFPSFSNGTIKSHIDEIENSADILTQLKMREEQLETLNQECENIRKENFNLRQSLYKQKQQTDLLRANTRRDVPSSAPPCSKDGRRPSTDGVMNVGLDANLAQALRMFFRDIKVVQQNITDMKQYAKHVQSGTNNNGGMKVALEKQEECLSDADGKLTKCIDSLKESVKNTLKKAKS